MLKEGMTIREAAQHWVSSFNAIPYAVCEKLLQVSCEELHEVTPPSKNDRVSIHSGEHAGEYGMIIQSCYDDEDDLYLIELDGSDEDAILSIDEFDVEQDSFLPMWGTLWAFDGSIDNWWLEEKGGLQAMADCGFRIYEQEDYDYIFGIDGAGYDFYEQHWIPLYKARGLRWHDPETDEVRTE